MKNKWILFSTGFALFSMFFGSGNLVFPVTVGKESGAHFFLSSLGILLTGVFLPFLGIFGMMLYKGSIQNFFSCFGKKGTFWFSLLSLSLMGPFGVLARCLTVAHGSLELLFPKVPLAVVSFILCCIIFFITVNKSKILTILGTYLTPILLLSIAAIAYFGLKDVSLPTLSSGDGWKSFKNGFFQGYQTMDLLAAFFFSTFAIKQLQKTSKESEDSPAFSKNFIKCALIGGGILSLVYIVLVLLGSAHAAKLVNVPPQEMFGKIAMEVLGPLAAPVVCIAIVLSCLTTAIVLTSLFADFLRKDVAKEKIGNSLAILITLVIGFFMSTLEFSGIARFLAPVLEAIYPSLIVLTVVNIGHKLWGAKNSHWPVTLTFAAKLCFF